MARPSTCCSGSASKESARPRVDDHVFARPRHAGRADHPRSDRLGQDAWLQGPAQPCAFALASGLDECKLARAVTAVSLERLADLAVGPGANVQSGQVVSIGAELGQEELARAVAAAAYRRGARFVDVRYFDP